MLNLTQHEATAEQLAAGVIEPSIVNKPLIQALLTFTGLPTRSEVEQRAEELASTEWSPLHVFQGRLWLTGLRLHRTICN